MTSTAPARARRGPRHNAGSPRAGGCESRCRPSPEQISPTCSPGAHTRRSPRCVMTPPDGAELRRIVALAPEMTDRETWPEPDMRVVEDDRAPAPALDDDALPAGWGEWIAAEAEARGCPRDYVAAGLIVGASGWLGNARHAAATPTWHQPPHLWLALVGLPSAGKTPALRPIVETMRAIE